MRRWRLGGRFVLLLLIVANRINAVTSYCTYTCLSSTLQRRKESKLKLSNTKLPSAYSSLGSHSNGSGTAAISSWPIDTRSTARKINKKKNSNTIRAVPKTIAPSTAESVTNRAQFLTDSQRVGEVQRRVNANENTTNTHLSPRSPGPRGPCRTASQSRRGGCAGRWARSAGPPAGSRSASAWGSGGTGWSGKRRWAPWSSWAWSRQARVSPVSNRGANTQVSASVTVAIK
jgi:hypothetical protein